MLTWDKLIQIAKQGNPTPDQRVEKTPEEWRQLLTPEQFAVTREAGTERAFSSGMCSLFEPGHYGCLCCGTTLFDSVTKVDVVSIRQPETVH